MTWEKSLPGDFASGFLAAGSFCPALGETGVGVKLFSFVSIDSPLSKFLHAVAHPEYKAIFKYHAYRAAIVAFSDLSR